MAKAAAPSRGASSARTTPVAAAPPAAARTAVKPSRSADRALALQVRENESPWTVVELDEVRGELRAERDRLQQELATLEGSIADVLRDSGDGAGDDQADSGAKAFEREQEMSLLATSRESTLQIDRALARIEDGTYGTCEACDQPIGKLRLQAFPRATLCVSCKQKQERR
jgi:DnaK suppressor protein